MPETRFEDLPEVLKNVRTRPLFVMHLKVRPLVVVGATPGGNRRIGLVPGGSFEGERLSGQVIDGGSDWQAVRTDGSTALDVRLVLKTNDDAMIAMTYRGIRHGTAEVLARLNRGEIPRFVWKASLHRLCVLDTRQTPVVSNVHLI